MNHFAVHVKLTQHCKLAILHKKQKASQNKQNKPRSHSKNQK